MARVHATIGIENYKVEVHAGSHRLTADELPTLGGANAGPAPYELVLSGLAACTAITLRMYAERKRWALQAAHVDVHLMKDAQHERIERVLAFEGDLAPDQQARLLEIAEKTPVTLTLKRGIEIRTRLREHP